jgi:hypothetical protein
LHYLYRTDAEIFPERKEILHIQKGCLCETALCPVLQRLNGNMLIQNGNMLIPNVWTSAAANTLQSRCFIQSSRFMADVPIVCG